MSDRIQGFQRQSDGKGCLKQLPQELGERWACHATFVLALGLVEFAPGNVRNLLPQAPDAGFFLAGQSS